MTAKPIILVVEDEAEIRQFLKVLLQSNGFEMLEASSGEQGLSILNKSKPDLVILDLGLPGMDGLHSLTQIRKSNNVPVLILSVRDREDDKVKGLELGADDYLTKPFGAKELVARLRVLLRKHGITEASKKLEYGRLHIDKEKRFVSVAGAQIKLSDIEYKLLLVLA